MKAAAQRHDIKAAGYTIRIKKPGILEQVNIIRLLGKDDAENTVLMSIYAPLAYVAAIDGEDVARPTSRRELDALLSRLEDEGVTSLMEGVAKHYGNPDTEADRA